MMPVSNHEEVLPGFSTLGAVTDLEKFEELCTTHEFSHLSFKISWILLFKNQNATISQLKSRRAKFKIGIIFGSCLIIVIRL